MLEGGSLVGNESASVLSSILSRTSFLFSGSPGRSSGSRRLPVLSQFGFPPAPASPGSAVCLCSSVAIACSLCSCMLERKSQRRVVRAWGETVGLSRWFSSCLTIASPRLHFRQAAETQAAVRLRPPFLAGFTWVSEACCTAWADFFLPSICAKLC